MMNGTVSPALFQHLMLDEVGSTNDEARRLALSGAAADCFVVSAQSQTSGRGRRGRQWHSPVGNVHMSVLVNIDDQLPVAAQLGFAASIAMVDALRHLLPETDFRCKWPNDILLNGKKCAGMLLEAIDQQWLVIGLGVDVHPLQDAAELLYPIDCLRNHGFNGNAQDVIASFMARFIPLLQSWRATGFLALRQLWLDRAKGIGGPVVVRLDQDTLCGDFLGLDADGALLLQPANGTVRPVHAGDVFFPPV